MRYIRLFHSILGIIPFIWFLSFLLILTMGIIHIGYVPKYGNPIDPYALNLDVISYLHFIFGLCAYLAFYLWIGMSIILVIFFKKKFSFHRASTILFIIGVSGFFIFRYIFPDVFGWILD